MNENKIFNIIKKTVLDLHKEARKYQKRKDKNKKSKIKYGRSPSLSNYFEENFVNELSKIYKQYLFYIDYPIHLYDSKGNTLKNSQNKSQNIYPDIIITDKEDILKAIIELKMDIGHIDLKEFNFKRERNLLKAKFGELNPIVGKYSRKKYKTKKIGIHFPKKFKKILIVVTLVNQHTFKGHPKSNKYKKIMEKHHYKPLFLLEKNHYNFYDDLTTDIESEIDKKRGDIIKVFKGL